MSENKPYFFQDGINELSQELSGEENIFLGIRPYGFHAGNKIPFIVYPLLLCEAMQNVGKKPKFTFYLFLNDWEQDGFDSTYTDIKTHPFNVLPKFTTFQYTLYEGGGGSIVDYWESKIIEQVCIIKDKFPSVQLRCVRNSYMRDDPVMKDVVLKTIKNPHLVGKVLKETTGREILEYPYSYCRPICPRCKTAKTFAKVLGEDDVHISCGNCGLERVYNYHLLHFWLYHKPLALPRIKRYNIDLCITGKDHYNEGDFTSRQKLFEAYEIKMDKMPKTLYAPTLYGRNGKPMGKSKGNYEDLPTQELYELVSSHINEDQISLPLKEG